MKSELSNNLNIRKLLDERMQMAGEMAKEVAEHEFEILELNLFVSSMGEKRLNRASKDVQEIRKLADSGKIDLSKYENIAEEF